MRFVRFSHVASIVFIAAAPLLAQQTTRFDSVPDKSVVRVEGTSSLHDWHVESSNISGHIDLKKDLPANATWEELHKILATDPKADIDVTIPANKLSSGKKDMNKKMYDALKTDKNPDIKYQLTKIELKEAKTEKDPVVVTTTGNLTIAGETRELQMPMNIEVVDATHLKISGDASLKMTDFKISPPTAMLGTIKSGDEVKVHFEWNTARAEDAKKP